METILEDIQSLFVKTLLFSPSGSAIWVSLTVQALIVRIWRNWNLKSPCDPAIPLLAKYSTKSRDSNK